MNRRKTKRPGHSVTTEPTGALFTSAYGNDQTVTVSATSLNLSLIHIYIMSKKALCIGINDYPGTQNDLSGCVNDANDWAAELGSHGYTVTKMLDGQATHAAMTAAIGSLIKSAVNGDTLVITLSLIHI